MQYEVTEVAVIAPPNAPEDRCFAASVAVLVYLTAIITLYMLQMQYEVTEVAGIDPPEAAEDRDPRTFYIAAEEVTWDYAPLGFDGCSGQPFTTAQSVSPLLRA